MPTSSSLQHPPAIYDHSHPFPFRPLLVFTLSNSLCILPNTYFLFQFTRIQFIKSSTILRAFLHPPPTFILASLKHGETFLRLLLYTDAHITIIFMKKVYRLNEEKKVKILKCRIYYHCFGVTFINRI